MSVLSVKVNLSIKQFHELAVPLFVMPTSFAHSTNTTLQESLIGRGFKVIQAPTISFYFI